MALRARSSVLGHDGLCLNPRRRDEVGATATVVRRKKREVPAQRGCTQLLDSRRAPGQIGCDESFATSPAAVLIPAASL